MTQERLITKIKEWLDDYDNTTNSNLSLDTDDNTFEGSAYNLLTETLKVFSQFYNPSKYKPTKPSKALLDKLFKFDIKQ